MKEQIMPEFILPLFYFIYGLCIGSFLNVCIYRIPYSKSLIYPASSCPACGTPIKFYDNIPVLSFIWLLGKCRVCKLPISFRYPFVEFLTGITWMMCYFRFGFSLECLVMIIFLSTLILISFIDLDHRIIPDIISLPGIPFFFLAAIYFTPLDWKNALFGILLGGGSLFLVAESYFLITKKEGMGGGDIKLLAMIGALIGWKGVFFTIFAASAIGTIVGFSIMIATRNNMKLAVPFGPFLSLGTALYLFYGNEIIQWYYGLTFSYM